MMPTDDKLKRELARGPLKKSGFDDRLRRRIEERLDEGPSRRPFRLHRLAGAGLTLCVMIAAAVLLVRLHPMYTEEAQQAAETVAQETPADTAAVEDAEETHRRSVLLLGLRRDGADGEPSAYRTLLVSGGTDPSDWSAAEGGGIIMPYRTDFWRLDVREYRGAGGVIRLAGAWNASRGDDMPPPSPIPEDGSADRVEERILFAGNRYIAIARRTSGEWTHRMMDIADLAVQRNVAEIVSGADPQVYLDAKNGKLGVAETDNPEQLSFGEWRFTRRAGLWMAFGRELKGGVPVRYADNREMGVVFDASIVAHNRLSLNWMDIRAAQPAAVDAVTSPIRNMAAILTDRQIVFYGMKHDRLDRVMLELPLEPGETVIMAEWATHVDYVDEWIGRVGGLMEEASGRSG